MGPLTAAARLLRLDRDTWLQHAAGGSLVVAVSLVIGAYAILAFDRLGPQTFFEPRLVARFLLVGFYGWVWLAATAWMMGRVVLRRPVSFTLTVRLFGYAHLPVVVIAVAILLASLVLQVVWPARTATVFAVVFWLPASLVAAARPALATGSRTALFVIVGPYLVWLLVVGRTLSREIGHLV